MEGQIMRERGHGKLECDGFVYTFDKISKLDNLLKFWRCEQKIICNGRIHTKAGVVVKKINEHTHFSSPARVEVAKVVTEIKRRAENSVEATTGVINQCLVGTSLGSQAGIPNNTALRKMIRRKRRDIHAYPTDPSNLESLTIPEVYKQYMCQPRIQEKILLCDIGQGLDRILIFGRQSWVEHLNVSEVWYMDGTFSIAPKLFTQVYTIMCERYGGILPVIYALLPNKKRTTYIRMFAALKELQPNLRPQSINCDFEQAAISAALEMFPGVTIKGCFFHLSQNLRKHVTYMGLLSEFNNDADFSLKARMIIALAFVKIEDLDVYLDALYEHLPLELSPVINWFEDTYMGRRNRRGTGRHQPLFSPCIWNLHERTLHGEDRTNNYSEAAHRRLQVELGMKNPCIWKFIDGLWKVQKGRDVYMEHLVAGHQPPMKLKKFRDADSRILKIVREYGSRNPIEYLSGLSHNYEML